MSENDKGQEGDDGDDTLPTEFVSTDDNDAKTAHSEFQEQFALQPVKLKSLEVDHSQDSTLSTVGNYDRESRNISELESIRKLAALGKYSKETRDSLRAYAGRNGLIINFEFYESNYDAIIDELVLRAEARRKVLK